MTAKPNQKQRLVHHIVVGVDRSKIESSKINDAYKAIKEVLRACAEAGAYDVIYAAYQTR